MFIIYLGNFLDRFLILVYIIVLSLVNKANFGISFFFFIFNVPENMTITKQNYWVFTSDSYQTCMTLKHDKPILPTIVKFELRLTAFLLTVLSGGNERLLGVKERTHFLF